MSFLKRLALIRQINNGQDAEHAGAHPEGITFIQESHGRSCVISEPNLVKALLEHPDAHAYNHLSDFLSDIEPARIEHLQHFLEQSPEFLEGTRQRERLKDTKRILKIFETACRQVKPEDLQTAIQQACDQDVPLTTSHLSKTALSECLNLALKYFPQRANPQPFSPSLITTKGGFFSAAPRIKRLLEMNQTICGQWGQPTTESTADDQYLLELLRIMGSIPMHAAITGSLNSLQQWKPRDDTTYAVPDDLLTDECFSRVVPTRYVTRRVTQKLTLDGITFEQGDGLILFLVDATQSKKCPLRKLNVLPFGAGRHFCPGKSVALIIHNTCMKAVAMSGVLEHSHPSECKQNSLNAFVDYGP